jgi:hypothetical protein
LSGRRREQALQLGPWCGLFCAMWVSLVVSGCVYRVPVADTALLDQLSLLDPGLVTRATVEAQLGPPAQSFEGGEISAYPVQVYDRHLVSQPLHAEARPRYWLMVQYGVDDVLVRRSLVPVPPESPE